MGLSLESRFNQITNAVNDIFINSKLLSKDFSELRDYCKKIWYVFLKNSSNFNLWLAGSDFACSSFEEPNLLSVAFSNSLFISNSLPFEEVYGRNSGFGGYLDSARNLLKIPVLLKDHKDASLLVTIFSFTEKIVYASCYYNDDFKESLNDLNELVRTIQGICFNEFKKPIYSYVYMMHHISNLLLTYDEGDFINQWWQRENLHHDFKPVKFWDNYNFVFKLYKNIQFKKDLSLQERLEITLYFIKYSWGNKSQKESLLKEILNHNSNKEQKIDIQSIEKILEAINISKKDESYTTSCSFTGNFYDSKNPEGSSKVIFPMEENNEFK